nr:uncharacterized protein LOC128700134 isoform X1 [Cherax quadricarinatus]
MAPQDPPPADQQITIETSRKQELKREQRLQRAQRLKNLFTLAHLQHEEYRRQHEGKLKQIPPGTDPDLLELLKHLCPPFEELILDNQMKLLNRQVVRCEYYLLEPGSKVIYSEHPGQDIFQVVLERPANMKPYINHVRSNPGPPYKSIFSPGVPYALNVKAPQHLVEKCSLPLATLDVRGIAKKRSLLKLVEERNKGVTLSLLNDLQVNESPPGKSVTSSSVVLNCQHGKPLADKSAGGDCASGNCLSCDACDPFFIKKRKRKRKRKNKNGQLSTLKQPEFSGGRELSNNRESKDLKGKNKSTKNVVLPPITPPPPKSPPLLIDLTGFSPKSPPVLINLSDLSSLDSPFLLATTSKETPMATTSKASSENRTHLENLNDIEKGSNQITEFQTQTSTLKRGFPFRKSECNASKKARLNIESTSSFSLQDISSCSEAKEFSPFRTPAKASLKRQKENDSATKEKANEEVNRTEHQIVNSELREDNQYNSNTPIQQEHVEELSKCMPDDNEVIHQLKNPKSRSVIAELTQKEEVNFRNTPVSQAIETSVRYDPGGQNISPSDSPRSSSASTEILEAAGKECLEEIVSKLMCYFGRASSEISELLKKNSFNLLTTIQELQELDSFGEVQEPHSDAEMQEPPSQAQVQGPHSDAEVQEAHSDAEMQEPTSRAKSQEPHLEAGAQGPCLEVEAQDPHSDAGAQELLSETKRRIEKVTATGADNSETKRKWICSQNSRLSEEFNSASEANIIEPPNLSYQVSTVYISSADIDSVCSVFTPLCTSTQREEDDVIQKLLKDTNNTLTTPVSGGTEEPVVNYSTGQEIPSCSLDSDSSASIELLQPRGKACLQSTVFVLQFWFTGTLVEKLEILIKNKFNIVSTIHELQTLYAEVEGAPGNTEREPRSSGE